MRDLIPIIADVIVHGASEDCVGVRSTETGVLHLLVTKCWDDIRFVTGGQNPALQAFIC